MVESAPNALVSYAAVLRRDEFQGAIQRAAPTSGSKFKSGVQELIAVSQILKKRPQHRRVALAGRSIFTNAHVEIQALSPSDEDFENFLGEVASWAAADGVDRILTVPNRNDISVVLVFKTPDNLLLFGADLEVKSDLCGWQNVHEMHWNNRGTCSFYKIAHHGSITGHYEPKWEHMLVPDVVAVLTPFGKGKKKLPSNDDVERIKSKTTQGFLAGDSQIYRGRRQNNTVERTLAEADIKLMRVSDKLGHVRLRKSFGGESWVPSLLGQAFAL